MKIELSREAGECLTAIAGYYSAFGPVAAHAVHADIEATIHRIKRHPQIYVLIGYDDIRRAVTRRYSFVIYFQIVDAGTIAVLSIRGRAQAPRFPRP